MKKNDKNLKSIEELRNMAREYGVLDNPLFETTLSRYETQIYVLDKLGETINTSDVLVTKEYVKGRANIATHPAITEYNRTTDSANKTVATLMKIIKGFDGGNGGNDTDPLMEAINGSDDNE
jgi:hypothetical protein